MSKSRPYHIPHKGATIATYWLLQWVGLVLVVAGITVVTGDWTLLVYEIVSFVIMGTVCALLLMIVQAAYAAAPSAVGGRREIGKLRSGLSITTAAAGVTGLCSLVMWLLIAGVAALSASAETAIPLMIAGLGGMIAMFVVWIVQIHAFLGKGRREQQYLKLTARMLAGTCLSAMACAAIGFIAMLVTGDGEVLLAVMIMYSPWLVGAAIALLGCLLYLKRLWTVRAPWYETHCAECGYDLSGNLTVTQCSECGTPWKHPQVSTPASAGTAQNE